MSTTVAVFAVESLVAVNVGAVVGNIGTLSVLLATLADNKQLVAVAVTEYCKLALGTESVNGPAAVTAVAVVHVQSMIHRLQPKGLAVTS